MTALPGISCLMLSIGAHERGRSSLSRHLRLVAFAPLWRSGTTNKRQSERLMCSAPGTCVSEVK